LDLKKIGIVARFELLEALRSRLALFVVGVYAAGAALGAWAFAGALRAAELTARSALAESMGVPADSLPADLVRQKAIPSIARGIEDERIREVLLTMDPLGIFYGFMALNLVAVFVLLMSSAAHAGDLESGAARFALFRVDRASWALGKTLGQAALLAAGLLVGALVSGLVGLRLDSAFSLSTFLSLHRASLSAWLYGLAYLGLFGGLSMNARTPLRARGLSFVLLVALALGHALVSSEAVQARAPALAHARWLFPAEYKSGLWFTDLGSFAVSVVGLLGLGALGLWLGIRGFERRDA
jgi:ABC-type transport system involved in multi-copper enzyme maturation permease subunit